MDDERAHADADTDEAPRRRRRNPFTGSSLGGRILSATQLPLFLLRPPRDYGVLQTTGRKSGQRRRCCVRIVQRGDQACVVAIGGRGVGWLANIAHDPRVDVRVRGGWRSATAHIVDDELPEDLLAAYRDSVGLFCYGEYLMWRPGRPTRTEFATSAPTGSRPARGLARRRPIASQGLVLP